MDTIATDHMRIPDVAATLECSIRTVWRRIDAGVLSTVKEGGRTYVARAAVDAYIDSLSTAA